MIDILSRILTIAFIVIGTTNVVHSQNANTLPYVDNTGAISLPDLDEVRTRWAYLGSWTVQGDETAESVHTVYTQPGSIEKFRADGKFPDGAVLVKEVRKAVTVSMTTGEVARSGDEILWFVMIKDSQKRYKNHALWGKGWGWAKFLAENPTKNVATNYRADCLGCHVPAKKSDWIYTEGYPALQK